jgi:hypothetical protein
MKLGKDSKRFLELVEEGIVPEFCDELLQMFEDDESVFDGLTRWPIDGIAHKDLLCTVEPILNVRRPLPQKIKVLTAAIWLSSSCSRSSRTSKSAADLFSTIPSSGPSTTFTKAVANSSSEVHKDTLLVIMKLTNYF